MKRPHPFVLFLLLLGTLAPLRGQSVLEGRVADTAGAPVPFAHVGVVSAPQPYGVVTDDGGRFRLAVKEADSVTLRITCVGFEPQQARLLPAAGILRLDVVLRPSANRLSEVVVSDDRLRTSAFTQINIQRIENTVGPNDGVEALIKTLPDVVSNNELSSQYSVRGGSFDENLVYINGVEIYRPQLIRSGQQEGMSIINPDLVDHVLFSPGGFDASCGDKLSSALDITYSRPVCRRHRVSLSLLGGSLSAQGRIKDRFSYGVGFRLHNNRYLFKSLDTEGNYTSSYFDLQGVFGYRLSDHFDLSLLTVWTRNRYGLVPSSRTTTFGSFMQSLELEVFFDGKEEDRYGTLLGALSLDYHDDDGLFLRLTASAQGNREQECYDIQSQYWLYEVGAGEGGSDTNRFDRGVGTFLEHARNALDVRVYAAELKGTKYAPLGAWNFGAKFQAEQVSDRMREWKWVDSAGYSFPTTHPVPGLSDTVVLAPLLQLFCNADNSLLTLRGMAYAQREASLTTRREGVFKLVAGVRLHQYGSRTYDSLLSSQFLCSPRLSVNYKPHTRQDILFRIAGGVYQQPAFYRELRRLDGSLCAGLPAQSSYQAAGTFDWNTRISDKPFRLTADIYYKYITHLVPYTIDNLRIRYNPDAEAVGYAAGVSLRVNGDFVEGLESWASLSWMKTQEDILGDGLGWLSRPTDQRFSFKLFLQDYIPTIPWWRMSLNFLYGTGTPVTFPYQKDRSVEHRLPPYFRVDWGNTMQLTRFRSIRHSAVGRIFDELSIGVEVFNLFNYHNVVSYIWVADYDNIYYPVPNYLTARQVNLKLTATF